MNYLILVNNAPHYKKTYIKIADELVKKGHSVIFALDSRVTNYTYTDSILNYTTYYFTDYFEANYNNKTLPSAYNDINLWNMFYSDLERFLIYNLNSKKPKDYYTKCILNLINFFDLLIKKENIDIILYENVSNSFAYAAYTATQAQGKKYLGISSTRLKNRFEIHDTLEGNAIKILSKYNEIKNKTIIVPEEVKSWVLEYLKTFNTAVPDYMKNSPLDTKINLFKKYFSTDKIKLFKNYLIYLWNESELYFAYQIDNPFKLSFEMIKRNIYRKVKLRFIDKFYVETSKKDKFYLYPLHYHPESSTSVLSPNFANELSVIENISKNLPFGTFLYVKDHMSSAGYPSLNFYKKLSSLPNVKLLHYSQNTKNLIQNSLAVITLTSTVGYEALLLNKKVFLFGNVFYSKHPNCIKVNSFDTFYSDIKNIEIKYNSKKINFDFLCAYYMNTYEGTVIYSQDVNRLMVKNFIRYTKHIDE